MTKPRPLPTPGLHHSLRSSVAKGPQSLEDLRRVGPRAGAIQIVPPRHVYRPRILAAAERENHELVTQPLASPTGPGGAAGFHNVAGSQLAVPQVVNVYLGDFWGDQAFLEAFSQAVVEFGYLQPLQDLGYGTGPGNYLGPVAGQAIAAGTVFNDSDAKALVAGMVDAGQLTAVGDSLFMLILPTGVTARFDGDGSESCSSFCGYHDVVDHNGAQIAYAVMPSPVGCAGCGDGEIGDFTAVYAHELAEAATDKVPGQGWVADDGEECGDLEAWILFGWGPPSDPNRYTIQGYYTNERGNTVGAWSGPPA